MQKRNYKYYNRESFVFGKLNPPKVEIGSVFLTSAQEAVYTGEQRSRDRSFNYLIKNLNAVADIPKDINVEIPVDNLENQDELTIAENIGQKAVEIEHESNLLLENIDEKIQKLNEQIDNLRSKRSNITTDIEAQKTSLVLSNSSIIPNSYKIDFKSKLETLLSVERNIIELITVRQYYINYQNGKYNNKTEPNLKFEDAVKDNIKPEVVDIIIDILDSECNYRDLDNDNQKLFSVTNTIDGLNFHLRTIVYRLIESKNTNLDHLAKILGKVKKFYGETQYNYESTIIIYFLENSPLLEGLSDNQFKDIVDQSLVYLSLSSKSDLTKNVKSDIKSFVSERKKLVKKYFKISAFG